MDVAVVRDVADQYAASAAVLDAAVATHLAHLGFGGASAGRAYAARGDALRTSLDCIAYGLIQWSRASAEIAAALRASADRYVSADERAGARIG
jgi:Excreted virulence factor EspC, type VII ESX diderm